MALKNQEPQLIRIEAKTIVKVMVVVALTLLAMNIIRNIVHPLTLIAISFFLALALNPAVSKITSILRIKSRVAATGIAYIAVVAFLVAFFAFVFPPLVKQTVDFVRDVPATVQDYKNGNSPLNTVVERYNLENQVDEFTNDFGSRFGNVGGTVLSTTTKVGSAIISLITVLVLTFMMLVEGPRWIERFWKSQKPSTRKHRQDLALQMYRTVTSYVNGQVIIAALGGFFAAIALFILSQIFDANINPVALGGIISLFALLPLIGTTIGSAIVFLACLIVSVPLALAFAVYVIIYQQIENVTIQPYIQSRGNNLTALIVFTAALLGVGVAGILGAFAAIPVAGCIKILIEDYFTHHRDDIKV